MQRARICWVLWLMCLAWAAVANEVPAAAPVMEVRYFDRGTLDARHAYKFQLIHELLAVTRPEFGDYKVSSFGNESSAKRQALLISEGEILNLTWASPGTVIARAEVISIPVDILKGLLGFRVCLINPANFPARVDTIDELSIGQGLNWSDVEIYRFNELQVRQAPSFEALFDMLAAKRFQCLPLGADEVAFTWREKRETYPFLQLESRLLIYYDHPVYLQVSKKHPELARRLTLGLARLQQNGRFDQLFNDYHARDLELLALPQRRIFCLVSPYLPLAGQCTRNPFFSQPQR